MQHSSKKEDSIIGKSYSIHRIQNHGVLIEEMSVKVQFCLSGKIYLPDDIYLSLLSYLLLNLALGNNLN